MQKEELLKRVQATKTDLEKQMVDYMDKHQLQYLPTDAVIELIAYAFQRGAEAVIEVLE